MKVKINFVSLFLLISVFTFQSQHTAGQNGGNGVRSNWVAQNKPVVNAELVRDTRSAKGVDDAKHNEISPEKYHDTLARSIEKEHADDEDGSSSSSSSSSEEADPFSSSTIGTTFRPASNGSSAALEKKLKLMKMDTARLVKPRPRDGRKSDNWYNVKRSASASESASISGGSKAGGSSKGGGGSKGSGGTKVSGSNRGGGGNKGVGGTKIKQAQQQQRMKQKGRNMGGNPEEEGLNKDGAASPDIMKLSGPQGAQEAGKGKKDPFGKNIPGDGGTVVGGDMLVNKTSKKPYNVERATRPIDPSLYSFFQFKPSESIGFLWTQSAGLGARAGRIDMIGNDKGTDEDDLDPASMFDWEFRRYDRACLYIEYTVNKAQMNSTQVSDEVSRMVDGQNEQLARRFLDWQFINKEDHETIALKGQGEKHPLHLTYKFLTITLEIFRDKICRNATPYATAPEIKPFAPASAPSKAEANKKYIDTKLLPKSFVDDLFRLFLTLRDITLPKGVPDYPTKKDEEDIYTEVLENCLKLDPIQWYSHTCGDQVLSYDEPHNYACTPLIDYDFNYKEYDPILDGMWHIFTAVHAFCFEEFNKRNTRLWHKYSMILANSYTVGMRTRWKASIAEPKFYRRLLGPDHTTHLETMNRCMFAATLRSKVPAVLPRFLSLAPITFLKDRTVAKDGSESHPKD